MSDMSLGKIVQRFFLYIGIALAVLVAIGLTIVLTKGEIGRISGVWFGLAMYTSLLLWVIIRQSREYWRRRTFWLALAGLLVVHLFAFVAILHAYPQWRVIWFVPVVIVEGGLFGAILYLLFGERKHH